MSVQSSNWNLHTEEQRGESKAIDENMQHKHILFEIFLFYWLWKRATYISSLRTMVTIALLFKFTLNQLHFCSWSLTFWRQQHPANQAASANHHMKKKRVVAKHKINKGELFQTLYRLRHSSLYRLRHSSKHFVHFTTTHILCMQVGFGD